MPMLPGPGPVFAYEWLTSARRWQHYAMRALFVGALLIALAIAYFVWRPAPLGMTALLAAMALAFTLPATMSVVPALSRLWLSQGAATPSLARQQCAVQSLVPAGMVASSRCAV